MYIIEPTIIQKILNKSDRTTGNSYNRYSTPPQYLRIIVPRFEVDWMKTQGEMALQFSDIMG